MVNKGSLDEIIWVRVGPNSMTGHLQEKRKRRWICSWEIRAPGLLPWFCTYLYFVNSSYIHWAPVSCLSWAGHCCLQPRPVLTELVVHWGSQTLKYYSKQMGSFNNCNSYLNCNFSGIVISAPKNTGHLWRCLEKKKKKRATKGKPM